MNPLNLTPEKLHQMVQDKADETWLELRKIYAKLHCIRPKVKYNKRLKTTAGRAHIEEFPAFVELSHSLLWEHPIEMVNVTLPHELAHVAAWIIFEDGGHGKGWKTVMRAIGQEPTVYHTLTNTLHEMQKAARMLAR